MSRDGGGGYNLPEAAFVFDTVIEETKVNNNFSDLGAEIANSIAKDGQTPPSANLPMNANKHTGVADATARTEYAAAGQVTDGSLQYAGVATGTADALALAMSPAVTALVTGMEFLFQASASPNTTAATVTINGLTPVALELNDAALVANDIVASKWYKGVYDGTAVQISRVSFTPGDLLAANNLSDVASASTALTNLGGQADLAVPSQAEAEAGVATTERVWTAERVGQAIAALTGLPRAYLSGCKVSNGTDTAHDLDITAGEWRDDTDTEDIVIAAITKQLDAAWAVGTNQGMLDGTESVGGTPDANTWYHIYAIKRTDTGVTDVVASESATAPTLPTNYDVQRRIFSVLTDGSANILPFDQNGDRVDWLDPPADMNGAASTAGALVALSTPLGVICEALVNVVAAVNQLVYLSNPAVNNEAPSISASPLTTVSPSAGSAAFGSGPHPVMTDTSSQIRQRASITSTLQLTTIGYIDRRGRDD